MKCVFLRRALAATALMLVVALLAGCASSTTDQPEPASTTPTEVKIGFAAPLTGDNALYGEGMKRAVELALEEANASQEVKDAKYTFVLRAEDDQADPKQAVNVANLLVSDPAVVGVVGHFNSGCSIPASGVYYRAGLAMISVSSNPQLTASAYFNVNRIVAKDDAQGMFAAQLLKDKLGFTKVAIVDDSTPYGQGLADEFTKTFEKAGGTIVAREKVQPKEVDFSAVVTKLDAAAPQAIYYAGALNEGALLAKQAKERGLDVPLAGGDMIYTPEFIKIAGAKNAEGDLSTALGLPLEQQPKGKEFIEKYKAKFNVNPEAYDSYAYDSAWIFVKSVLATKPDRTQVAQAVRAGTFDGVTGSVKFDGNGDNMQQIISAYEVKNGAWVQVPFTP
jgi:branched-chain amino acid transport system substrate-binding protein